MFPIKDIHLHSGLPCMGCGKIYEWITEKSPHFFMTFQGERKWMCHPCAIEEDLGKLYVPEKKTLGDYF